MTPAAFEIFGLPISKIQNASDICTTPPLLDLLAELTDGLGLPGQVAASSVLTLAQWLS